MQKKFHLNWFRSHLDLDLFRFKSLLDLYRFNHI